MSILPHAIPAARRPRSGRGCTVLLGVAAALALLPAAASPQEGDLHAVIVVGLGGTPEYRDRFLGYARELQGALTERYGVAPGRVTVLAERRDADTVLVSGRSTRAEVLRVLGELSRRAGPEDRVLLVLIGHGTANGREVRFNVPGPDLGPEDLAAGLGAFPTQRLALAHLGSGSGGFLEPLSGPGRVIIAATRTARELNATEFPRFFVAALAGDGADLDKDGTVSLLEAFEFASLETARFYSESGEILTEHAVLDDNGDGEGSRDPAVDAPDGGLAARWLLGAAPARASAADDPELARLYRERADIRTRIDSLRAARGSMTAQRYDEELEALLVELALKTREIRAREGGGP